VYICIYYKSPTKIYNIISIGDANQERSEQRTTRGRLLHIILPVVMVDERQNGKRRKRAHIATTALAQVQTVSSKGPRLM
jgi:hypothetical protein